MRPIDAARMGDDIRDARDSFKVPSLGAMIPFSRYVPWGMIRRKAPSAGTPAGAGAAVPPVTPMAAGAPGGAPSRLPAGVPPAMPETQWAEEQFNTRDPAELNRLAGEIPWSTPPAPPADTVPGVVPQQIPPPPLTAPMPDYKLNVDSDGVPRSYYSRDPAALPPVPGMPRTDELGMLPGHVPVPVHGLAQGAAYAQIPEAQMQGGMRPIVLPPDVPAGQPGSPLPPRLAGGVPDFGGAAVLRTSDKADAQLKAWRNQGRTLQQKDANARRLQEFEQAQKAQETQATREAATRAQQAQLEKELAQAKPQAVAGAAGVATWDPTKKEWSQEMRPPNVTGAGGAADHTKVVDPDTGMTAAQLIQGVQKSRPRKKNDPVSMMMLQSALAQAGTDQAAKQRAYEMYGADNPGDPTMEAFYAGRLAALGIHVPGAAGAAGGAAQVAGAPASGAAGAAPGSMWKSRR